MLKVEDGKIQPGGYVELSETTLGELDLVAPVFLGDGGRLSIAAERVIDIGHNCGRIVAANCDVKDCEAIRDELTANMQEHIALGFNMGFVGGVKFEKKIYDSQNPFGTSL